MEKRPSADWIERIDANFLVEASAGTGKTHNLLERVLFLIEQARDFEMRKLAVITFTEKAAAQMRIRLRQRLEEQLSQRLGEGETAKAEKLETALAEFEQAEISTIHSFCGRLLKLRPVDAGLSPAFEVMDDSESALLFEREWEKWLENISTLDPGFQRAVWLAGFALEQVKDKARELYQDRDLFVSALPGLEQEAAKVDLATAERQIREFSAEVKDLIGATALVETLELMVRLLDECGNDPAKKERVFCQIDLGKLQKADWKDIPKNQRKNELKEKSLELFQQARSKILVRLFGYLHNFFQVLDREKKNQEVLDFMDLLLAARDLVKDNPEARRYFKNRYRHLLVDEFQDTDPVQVEVAFFLSEKLDGKESQWDRVELEPGKLVLVGDPKQSIYHFRRADLLIYEQAKQTVIRNNPGKMPVLQENRRSQKKILAWVNLTFQPRFDEMSQKHGPGFQPAYQKLVAAAESPELKPPLTSPVVILELQNRTGELLNTDEIRKLEAQALAGLIGNLVKTEFKIYDKSEKTHRPVSYRDFAILFPTHSSADNLQQEFRSRGIPFEIEASKDFPFREEIAGLISTLKCLANPLDSLALVSALRSLFFAVSDDELFEYKKTGGSWEWLGADPSSLKIPSLQKAFRFLNEMYQTRDRRSIYSLLEEIIERSGIRKVRRLDNQFSQALLNLERIKAAARGFESEMNFGLHDFIRWLELTEDKDQTWPEMVAQDAGDKVSFLTFHKSKGLEFPLVFIINLCGQPITPGLSLVKDWRNKRIGIRMGDFQTPDFDELAEREKIHRECERLRQFYVACTRAEQYLFLTDHRNLSDDGKAKYLQIIGLGMPAPGEQNHPASELIMRLDPETIGSESETRPVSLLLEFGRLKPSKSRLETDIAGFEIEHREKIARAKEFMEIKAPSREEGFEEFKAEDREPRERAMAIGVVAHRVVELAGKEKLEIALALAKRLARENDLMDALPELEQLLKNFWESDLQKDLTALPSFQEVPFLIEDGGKLWRGKMDLVLRSKDGLRLVDLKTDRIKPDQVAENNEKYRKQMEVYRKALSNLKNEKLAEVSIFYLKPGVRSKV